MDSRWVKGLKGPAKDLRTKEVLGYRNAFDALKEILEGHFEESSPSDYDVASWSHKQADVNGANRKLRQVIKLITIED